MEKQKHILEILQILEFEKDEFQKKNYNNKRLENGYFFNKFDKFLDSVIKFKETETLFSREVSEIINKNNIELLNIIFVYYYKKKNDKDIKNIDLKKYFLDFNKVLENIFIENKYYIDNIDKVKRLVDKF